MSYFRRYCKHLLVSFAKTVSKSKEQKIHSTIQRRLMTHGFYFVNTSNVKTDNRSEKSLCNTVRIFEIAYTGCFKKISIDVSRRRLVVSVCFSLVCWHFYKIDDLRNHWTDASEALLYLNDT